MQGSRMWIYTLACQESDEYLHPLLDLRYLSTLWRDPSRNFHSYIRTNIQVAENGEMLLHVVTRSIAEHLHRLLERGVAASAPSTADDFHLALSLAHDRLNQALWLPSELRRRLRSWSGGFKACLEGDGR